MSLCALLLHCIETSEHFFQESQDNLNFDLHAWYFGSLNLFTILVFAKKDYVVLCALDSVNVAILCIQGKPL